MSEFKMIEVNSLTLKDLKFILEALEKNRETVTD